MSSALGAVKREGEKVQPSITGNAPSY